MRKINVLLILIFSTSLFSFSQVEFAGGKFPFNQIQEWQGRGTLFLGTDPTGRTDEINLTLFNHKGEVDWNRSVYPKAKGTHLILSGMSDYIYFVDDLKPVNSDIRYNQVNISGSIIPTKVDILNVIRSYQYRNVNDIEVKDIVSTPKSLVLHLQLPLKKEGIIENFFVSITHHNNRVYHCKGPASNMERIKDGKEDSFVFASADDEIISFSRYNIEGKSGGIGLFSFTPKAEPRPESLYSIVHNSFIPSVTHFVGLNGSYYIEKGSKDKSVSNGQAIFLDNEFYYIINDAKDLCLKIFKRNDKGIMTQINECSNPATLSRRTSGSIHFAQIDKSSMLVISKINQNTSVFELKDGKATLLNQDTDIENLRQNTSATVAGVKEGKFIHYVGSEAYFIELKDIDQEIITFKKLK